MKFALFVLGALCCIQLTFADFSAKSDESIFGRIGLFEADIMKCIKDKELASKPISDMATENMKKCYSSGNFSPATKAAIDDIIAKSEYCNKIIKDLNNATTYLQKLINYGLAFNAYRSWFSAISTFFNTPNIDGASIVECVKTHYNPVLDAFYDLKTCFKF